MAKDKIFAIAFQLQEIDHLFEKPNISPLSKDYQVYSYIAGIEYISNELYANPSYDSVKLNLSLPADKITPELETETSAAVVRYCESRLKDVTHEIHSLRWRGKRTLAVATLALFVFIITSRLIFSDDNLIRQVISEGFSIAAWVSFWVPLDMLTFKVWEQRLDIKVYSLLSEMEINFLPGS